MYIYVNIWKLAVWPRNWRLKAHAQSPLRQSHDTEYEIATAPQYVLLIVPIVFNVCLIKIACLTIHEKNVKWNT